MRDNSYKGFYVKFILKGNEDNLTNLMTQEFVNFILKNSVYIIAKTNLK